MVDDRGFPGRNPDVPTAPRIRSKSPWPWNPPGSSANEPAARSNAALEITAFRGGPGYSNSSETDDDGISAQSLAGDRYQVVVFRTRRSALFEHVDKNLRVTRGR